MGFRVDLYLYMQDFLYFFFFTLLLFKAKNQHLIVDPVFVIGVIFKIFRLKRCLRVCFDLHVTQREKNTFNYFLVSHNVSFPLMASKPALPLISESLIK